MGSLQDRAKARSCSGFLILAAALLVFGGCSDSNGSGGVAGVTVVATSFLGTPAAPGGQPPEHFLDEVLLVTLSGPIDNLIFNGFVPSPGTTNAEVMEARIGPNGDRVLYYVYANQAAAAQAFQVLDDMTGAPFEGLIGRSVTSPNTLVFDPRIAPGNAAGLAATNGFVEKRQYDIFIPAGSDLRVGGKSVESFGALPPVAIPDFSDDPAPSTLLVTGTDFVPDTVPPTVTLITTMALDASGASPSDPIPFDDVFLVRFTEEIDPTSPSLFQNVVLRNLSVTTPEQPGGIILPTAITLAPDLMSLTVTPMPSLGEGPFDIELAVGSATPQNSITDRAGNAMVAIVSANFTTLSAAGTANVSTIIESFDDTSRQDVGATPRYNEASWNAVSPGALTGLPIEGAAGQPGDLGSGPGARTQFGIAPFGSNPPGAIGYFSPFDDDQNNNLGATINPSGGSHLQLLYNVATNLPTPELPIGLADSLELLEWRPGAPGTTAATYNGFTMRMGHTVSSAVLPGDPDQLTVLYDRNFSFDNPQNEFLMPTAHPDATNPRINEAPVTVIPPQPYTTPVTTDFTPFPLLSLPFDFDHNRTEPNIFGISVRPNLLVDINIDAGSLPSGNSWLGSTVASALPFRRLISGPGAINAFDLDAVVYHARMTFVKKNSSVMTTFFDSGSATTQWLDVLVSPPLALRPDGSSVSISIEGADSTAPVAGSTTPARFISRDGVVDQTALDSVQGKRFIRLLIEFESDTASNSSAIIDDLMLSFIP